MKKFVPALLALIAVLVVILFLKTNGVFPIIDTSKNSITSTSLSTSNYSNDDIQNLIIQGAETMASLGNWSFEVENSTEGKKPITWIEKYYYKEEKAKKELYFDNVATKTYITDAAKETLYQIQHKDKTVSVQHLSPKQLTSYVPKEQCSSAQVLKEVRKSTTNPYKYIFTYLRDGRLEGKDCILAKKEIVYLDEERCVKSVSDLVMVFWIEKSTGFILGRAAPENIDINTITPKQIIKNISFGNVKEDDFYVPNYRIAN